MGREIMRRNGAIDVLRFYYSFIIVLFHFYQDTYAHFALGFVSVEFFAIVSGVFFFSKWERCEKVRKYIYIYMKKRFFRFFPYTTVAFAVVALIRLYNSLDSISLQTLGRWISADIWEVLLVNMNGLNNGQNLVNAPAWYIGATLIAEFVVLNLLLSWEDKMKNFVIPLSILIGYGYWQNAPSPGPAPQAWLGVTTFGVVRIYWAFCVGYVVFVAAEKLRATHFTNFGRGVLTVIEVLCHVIAFYVMLVGFARYRNYIFLLIGLFAVSICITYSGASYSVQIFKQSNTTNCLGQLSLSVFLIQIPVIRFFTRLYSDVYIRYSHKWEFLLALLAAAVIFHVLVRSLTKKWIAIKNIFIKHCVVQPPEE